MGSCCGKRRHVRHQGHVWEPRQGSHRVGAILALVALLAMLVSHVVHTVEIASEAARPPALSPSLHPSSPETAPARFTIGAVPQEKVHDPFFCPVCRLLSQTRHVLVSTGTSFALPRCPVLGVPCWMLDSAGPDLAA